MQNPEHLARIEAIAKRADKFTYWLIAVSALVLAYNVDLPFTL